MEENDKSEGRGKEKKKRKKKLKEWYQSEFEEF